ncbi:MAG: hypothetical protein IJQ15_00175 [Synergistaceae bacterium]|nr:hypothetical protein [Synergistaceae bacterium]
MKKMIVMLSIVLLVLATECYGAVSDDVYVRKDVSEVYMQNINAKFDMIMEELKEQRKVMTDLSNRVSELAGRVDGLDKRIDGLDKRIDGVNASLSGRIDDLRNGIYLWLVAIGLVVSWPKVKEVAQKWGRVTPSITLDDVRRLIEENNAKLAGKPQA